MARFRNVNVTSLTGALLAMAVLNCPVMAQSSDATEAPSQPSQGAAAPEGGAPATPADTGDMLKGGVRGSALRMEDGLQKMGESTAEIRRSTQAMMQEVTRKQTQTLRSPNVLPGGVVINPIQMEFGNLPPRKKQMNYFMQQIEYHFTLLGNEIDALIIPEEKIPTISDQWNQIMALRKSIAENFDRLKELTAGRSYNNDKIGKEALGVYDKTNKLDKLRRQVIQTVSAK